MEKKEGAELKAYVEEVVLHDLLLLRQMKTAVAMPEKLSEPIVCHLMGWTWVKGHAKHDALDGKLRIQIKYSKSGFVTLKHGEPDNWDYLAWVHAPERLPKVLLLIPSRNLKEVPLYESLNFSTLRDNIRLENVKAKRFHLDSPDGILQTPFSKRWSNIKVDTALDQISAELKANR